MPCYDPRDNSDSALESRVRTKLVNEFQHNSNVAAMLCGVLTRVHPVDVLKLAEEVPGLATWWVEHQARDKAKPHA